MRTSKRFTNLLSTSTRTDESEQEIHKSKVMRTSRRCTKVKKNRAYELKIHKSGADKLKINESGAYKLKIHNICKSHGCELKIHNRC